MKALATCLLLLFLDDDDLERQRMARLFFARAPLLVSPSASRSKDLNLASARRTRPTRG